MILIRGKKISCLIVMGILLGALTLLTQLGTLEPEAQVGKVETQAEAHHNELTYEGQTLQSEFISVMQLGSHTAIAAIHEKAIATPPCFIIEITEDDAYEIKEHKPEPKPIFLDIPLSEELQLHTMQLCMEFGVCYDLIFAMMFVESTFRPHIISRTNDYGLMQINRVNHGWLREQHGITDFLCAEQNILSGLIMISDLIERYEDLHKALMAYNMGRTGARRRWNQGVFTSTYSERVIRIMNEYILQREYIKQIRENMRNEYYE